MLEAGSETIRMKRGDIIEAMIDEGLDPEIAKRVFERLVKRDYELKAVQAQIQADSMKARMDFSRQGPIGVFTTDTEVR
jgi:uncharacterized protein YajQ (UPF0234 family)